MQWYTIRAEGNSLFFLMEKRPSCTRSSGHLAEGLQLNGDSVGLLSAMEQNAEVPVQFCAKAVSWLKKGQNGTSSLVAECRIRQCERPCQEGMILRQVSLCICPCPEAVIHDLESAKVAHRVQAEPQIDHGPMLMMMND